MQLHDSIIFMRAIGMAAALALFSSLTSAFAVNESLNMGFIQLPQADGKMTTVFYPSSGTEVPVRHGPFNLSWVPDGQAIPGNRHLVVISHGSGGSPWVHADLARALVRRGFTVAIPLHQGDNYLDPSEPGPPSWRKRPQEISNAIDAVSSHALLAKHLTFDSVGIFGGSAGGHTALSLAGGQWSDQRFKAHCESYIEQDFSSCVGFTTLLKGNWLDGLKIWFAKRIIASRFTDETVQHYQDPRIKAAVAMVPFAADFIPESLSQPRVTLGLVTAEKDINQIPRFHVEAVRKACAANCELVLDLPDGGHGAMLSPMPPLEPDRIGSYLLGDPPSFDRARRIPELNDRIADFFIRNLKSGT
jgi:predicted dienelactone hydrolase